MLNSSVWKEFCGLPKKDALKVIEETLQSLEVQYKVYTSKASVYEQIIFGSQEKVLLETEYTNTTIMVLDIKGDAILRLLAKIMGESILLNISYIIIKSKNLNDFLRKFIPLFVRKSNSPPWVINHPRFRTTLLSLRVKRSWTKYLVWSGDIEELLREEDEIDKKRKKKSGENKGDKKT